MGYSKSASGILVCFLVAIVLVSNEIHGVKALGFTSDCRESCKRDEARTAHGCLWRCWYRCMPVIGNHERCHPTQFNGQTSDPSVPAADSAISTTRKIKI